MTGEPPARLRDYIQVFGQSLLEGYPRVAWVQAMVVFIPAPEELADRGTAWVRAGTSAVLVVPSVIVPQERNVLLNPAHRDFPRIRVGRPESFSFDPRMWRSL